MFLSHPEPERPFVHLWGKWQPSMCELHPVLLQRPHPPLFYSPIAQYCSTSPMRGNADEMQTLKNECSKHGKDQRFRNIHQRRSATVCHLAEVKWKKAEGKGKGKEKEPNPLRKRKILWNMARKRSRPRGQRRRRRRRGRGKRRQQWVNTTTRSKLSVVWRHNGSKMEAKRKVMRIDLKGKKF